MKKYKKGDKVTIRDINDIIKNDFELDNLISPLKYIIYSLENIKVNFGLVKEIIYSDGIIVYDPICNDQWYISSHLIFPYNDVSLPDDLFEI